MKKIKFNRAIGISFSFHLFLFMLALIPLVSMVESSDQTPDERIQYIQIAFENGTMSPGKASTRVDKADKPNNESIENRSTPDTQQALEEYEESTVVKESGEASEKESDSNRTNEEEYIDDGSAELSDSEKGEGDIGDNITGKSLADMDFEGEGVFGRQVVYHADISKLAEKEGRVVANLCIDRSGRVTHVAFNREASTLTDKEYISRVLRVASKYRFEADYSAPRIQCGKLTFIFMID